MKTFLLVTSLFLILSCNQKPVEYNNPLIDKLDSLNRVFDYNCYKRDREMDSTSFFIKSKDVETAKQHLLKARFYVREINKIEAESKFLLNKK